MYLIKNIFGLTSNFLVPYKKPEAKQTVPVTPWVSHCRSVLSILPLLLKGRRNHHVNIQLGSWVFVNPDLQLSSQPPATTLILAQQYPGVKLKNCRNLSAPVYFLPPSCLGCLGGRWIEYLRPRLGPRLGPRVQIMAEEIFTGSVVRSALLMRFMVQILPI